MWTNTDYELAEIADALNIEKEKGGLGTMNDNDSIKELKLRLKNEEEGYMIYLANGGKSDIYQEIEIEYLRSVIEYIASQEAKIERLQKIQGSILSGFAIDRVRQKIDNFIKEVMAGERGEEE